MSVKIIRPQEQPHYSMELRRVRIEFTDGSHLVGTINLHAGYTGENGGEEGFSPQDGKDQQKFFRTSDYLKSCTTREGVITVFKASYGGLTDKTFFVFLHSVKMIMEQPEEVKPPEPTPPPDPDRTLMEHVEFSLREKLKKKT